MGIDDACDDIKRKNELERKVEKNRQETDAEQKQKDYLEQLKKIYSGMAGVIDSAQKKLAEKEADKNKEAIKEHLREVYKKFSAEPKSEWDMAVVKFITHPEFIDIYKNALAIRDQGKRYEYVIIKAIKADAINWMGKNSEFAKRLAPLGLALTCPYYKEDETETTTGAYCLSDGTGDVLAGCEGGVSYHNCSGFQERARLIAAGAAGIIETDKMYKAPKISLSIDERERIEQEIDDEIEKWRNAE